MTPPTPQDSDRLNSHNSPTCDATYGHHGSSRPPLQSKPTTALFPADVSVQPARDGTCDTFESFPKGQETSSISTKLNSLSIPRDRSSSKSRNSQDCKTTLGSRDILSVRDKKLGVQGEYSLSLLPDHPHNTHSLNTFHLSDSLYETSAAFEAEFSNVTTEEDDDASSLSRWRSKKKHFMILSSAGKPIYTRHGDANLISSTVGVIQTIISGFEASGDALTYFTAADTQFAVSSKNPIYLVAVSKFLESEAQLKNQLEALYMQILSTLTLPALNAIFVHRPSSDLRRPLEGTEVLLSALCDSFTRGSPSALLTALECLRIRKGVRDLINESLLLHKSSKLLYGMIVAGGKLVSVARPRKHSLHPSDLQLIFNMLFEADGIKSGGGEAWIPLCLPGFNKNGFLYLYVSFIGALEQTGTLEGSNNDPCDTIATLLISADKEAFYEMRKMRDAVTQDLDKNGCMAAIKTSIRRGRLAPADISQGMTLRHFLYKSKAHVQFVMPSYQPHFDSSLDRRRLYSRYQSLHASLHAKKSHLKIQYNADQELVSLAWATPEFEFYCVGSHNLTRKALTMGVNKAIQWVKREEERLFIIGGAVF